MSELTKEYFDHHINDVTKGFGALQKKLLDQLVSKEEFDKGLKKLKTELTSTFEEKIDDLAGMTARGFLDIQSRLDVQDQIDVLNKDMGRIKNALSID